MTPVAPIIDYYGTEISVEVCGHSNGYMVDIDRYGTELEDSRTYTGRDATVETFSFDSLTAEQARELASRLVAAADEIEGRS